MTGRRGDGSVDPEPFPAVQIWVIILGLKPHEQRIVAEEFAYRMSDSCHTLADRVSAVRQWRAAPPDFRRTFAPSILRPIRIALLSQFDRYLDAPNPELWMLYTAWPVPGHPRETLFEALVNILLDDDFEHGSEVAAEIIAQYPRSPFCAPLAAEVQSRRGTPSFPTPFAL